jgi:proteasome lid subunit RPN8/RPN11
VTRQVEAGEGAVHRRAPLRPLLIPAPARRQIESRIRACGALGRECVVYLATRLSHDDGDERPVREIVQVFHPEHLGSAHHYEVPPEELHRIWVHLYRLGLSLVGQLHTHPGPAFHSRDDDADPVLHEPGAVSIVVPDFGAQGLGDLGRCHVSIYEGSGGWRRLTTEEVVDVVRIQGTARSEEDRNA